MILINRCYEIVTPESASEGEAAESGFIVENAEYGFRELVELLEGGEPSSYPSNGCTHDWVSHDQGETRAWLQQGERETHSTHYSRSNPPRNAKYWRWAMRAAGLTR